MVAALPLVPTLKKVVNSCFIRSEWDFNVMLQDLYFVVGTETCVYFLCLQRIKVGEGKYKVIAIEENICGS